MSLSKHRRKSDHHDLFISFRGSDTRTPIIDHLINYFRNNKINAFFDQTEIKAGENIRKTIRQAINKSTMYLVVFSDNYSESKYCLWELEAIVLEVEKAKGKQILAVFYGVTRDDVSLETNLYTEKLSKIEATESTVQAWKKALQYAAKVNQGLIATPNAEDAAHLCQQILERVQQMIAPKEPSVHLNVDLRGLPKFVSTKSSELLLAASKSLCIKDCNTLGSSLFSLPGQKELEQLRVSRCRMLKEIPCLGELTRLKVLIMEDCISLKSLPNLHMLVKLEVLRISFCPSLKEILGLSCLKSLNRLEISNCDNLRYVHINLCKLEKLEELLIKNCRNLRILGGDDISSQNLQSPTQNPNINWDNDHDNIQLPAENSVNPITQSGFVVETDHHAAFGRSLPHSVSYTGSSSTTVNTANEEEIFKERRFDESGTNSMVASRPVMLYHSWYPDPGATNQISNNTSPMVDSDMYHDTGTMVLDHEEHRTTISNDDCRDNSLRQLVTSPDEHTKEQQEISEELLNAWILIDKEEAALDVLRHFFSSGIQMGAAGSANDDTITSVAEAVQFLLSENVTSKGDAWKTFSTNVRFAYFDCMTDDNATLKNELQAKDFELAARISDQWLLLLKQHWDHLLAAACL